LTPHFIKVGRSNPPHLGNCIKVAKTSVKMKFDFSFLLFIVVGFYSIAGTALNWEWFMGDPKAKIVAHLFGRTGTRVFYILLRVGAVIFGFFGMFGLFG
jgi:hypothetical protein